LDFGFNQAFYSFNAFKLHTVKPVLTTTCQQQPAWSPQNQK
jgi:hypothetical protein